MARCRDGESWKKTVVHFVDNDAAPFGVIKGYSPSSSSAWQLTENAKHDMFSGAFTLVDRVPSKSETGRRSQQDAVRPNKAHAERIRTVEPPKEVNGGLWAS